MSTSIDRIARELVELRRQVRHLSSQPRLAYSSVEGGYILVRDDDGNDRQVIGTQEDGSVTITDRNGPPPGTPDAPTVSTDTPGLLTVTSYGLTADGSAWPLDLVGIDVHVSATSGFTPTAATKVDQFGPDGGSTAIALPAGIWYAALVAINTSGAASPPSAEASGEVTAPSETSSGIDVYFTDVEPTGTIITGSIWYDTDNGNQPHYWNGTDWQDARDQAIIDAQNAAEGAQAIAAAKTATWFQDDAPPGDSLSVGDEWVKPSEGNARYRWDGTEWQPAPLGADALSSDALANKVIPIATSVQLEWGVPNPTSAPAVGFTYGPESWQPTRADGITRVFLTPYPHSGSGWDYVYLKQLSDTQYQPVKLNTTTGAESNMGPVITTSEIVGGITYSGGHFFLTRTRVTSGGKIQWRVHVYDSDFSEQTNVFTVLSVDQNLDNFNDYWRGVNIVANGSGQLVLMYADYATNKLKVRRVSAVDGTNIGSTQTSTQVLVNTGIRDIAYDSSSSTYYALVWNFTTATIYPVTGVGGTLSVDDANKITLTGITAGGIAHEDSATRLTVNMGQGGLQRLTTSAAQNLWAAYTWADVDPGGTGTHETLVSPASAITIPAGLIMRWNSSAYAAPGAGAGGSDGADTVNLYLAARPSGTPPARTDLHKAGSATYPAVTISSAGDLSGANPPSATSFDEGSSGSILSKAGGFELHGDGTGDWPAFRTSVKGEVQIVGEVKMWPKATPPTGWLICNGQAVNRTTYAALFALIGTTFGSGDGSTTFNVPNFVDRFPIGAGTKAVGTVGGSATHTHPLSNNGQAKIRLQGGSSLAIESVAVNFTSSQKGTGLSSATPGAETFGAGLAGDTDSSSVIPPWAAIYFIIKA